MKRILFILFAFVAIQAIFAQGGTCFHKHDLSPFLNQKLPIASTDIDIKNIVFDLNIERDSRAISGNVTLKILATAAISEVELELHDNFTIDSIVVLKKNVKAKKTSVNHFSFPVSANKNELFDAKIYYKGSSPLTENDWGNGLVQKTDPTYKVDVTYSLSVPFFAHEWFPCKQVLSDLIDSVTMKITTDTSNTVTSNGLLVSDLAQKSGKHTVTWHTNYPINFYLISFVVGKYINYDFDVTLPGKKDKMRVKNYLYNAKALQAKKAILDNTEAFLGNYSKLFGTYPFDKEKFGTIITPLSGGMEHQTLVNLATDYDKYLLAHEMSHQWFGDNVNVKTFHDMWLNEGWASYCEYLTAEKIYPTEAVKYMNNFHNQSYNVTGRVYVEDTSSFIKIYNGLVYNKGAAICHTLRDEVGSDSLFFGAVTAVQSVYKNKSIDVPAFKAFVENYTGKNLTIFFNQWYYGYGYPRFTITYANKNNALTIRSLEQGSSNLTPLFKTKVEFTLKRTNQSDTLVSVYQNQNDQTFFIKNIKDVTGIVVDPRNVILNKVVGVKEDISLAVTDEEKGSSFDIFPNPAQGVLNIKTSQTGNYTIEIYSNDGSQLFKKEKMNEENLGIDISDFANGQYIVKIQDKGKLLLAKKILIVK